MLKLEEILASKDIYLILAVGLILFLFLIYYFRSEIKDLLNRLCLNYKNRKDIANVFNNVSSNYEEIKDSLSKILFFIGDEANIESERYKEVLFGLNKLLGDIKEVEEKLIERIENNDRSIEGIDRYLVSLKEDIPDITTKISIVTEDSKLNLERNAVLKENVDRLSKQLDKFNDLLVEMHQSAQFVLMKKVNF